VRSTSGDDGRKLFQCGAQRARIQGPRCNEPVRQSTSTSTCRSQWPRGLRRRSAAARFLKLWVRNPPTAWMSVCCECCVLLGRSLCKELITRPEESYRLWHVFVCDLENLMHEEALAHWGLSRQKK
jgi:hypothetical protein